MHRSFGETDAMVVQEERCSNPKYARNGDKNQRAQEHRVDEVLSAKVQRKSRNNSAAHFQLQQMQEHLKSMDDSGDFQDVESILAMICKFSFLAQPRQKIAA